MSKGELTPLEANPLVKDDNDEPSSGMFSYRVVVIVILYVSGHTCPDVDLAVIICARYTFIPKLSHKLALNILVNYLKQTKDQGSVLNPNYGVCKVYAYPDDYFEGCIDMRILLILYVLRSTPYLSSHLCIVLFLWFKSYRLVMLSQLWSHT